MELLKPTKDSERCSDTKIRELVARLLKRSRKSRAEIADQLATLTGLPVTVNMLNDWCSLGKRGLRFPLSLAAAFCQVTGTNDLLLAVIGEDLRKRVMLGHRALELRHILIAMNDEAAVLTQERSAKVMKRKRT